MIRASTLALVSARSEPSAWPSASSPTQRLVNSRRGTARLSRVCGGDSLKQRMLATVKLLSATMQLT